MKTEIAMKRCTECGEEKPLDAFHRNHRMRDGHINQCKECSRPRNREWNRQNRGVLTPMPEQDSCTTCGMLLGKEYPEFHPHALCLLVKARHGDTDAARKDMAFILDAARSEEPGQRAMVDRFLRQVDRRA